MEKIEPAIPTCYQMHPIGTICACPQVAFRDQRHKAVPIESIPHFERSVIRHRYNTIPGGADCTPSHRISMSL